MVTKSKLKLALAAEKGVDFRKIKEKRKAKTALKEKRKNGKSKHSVEEEPVENEEDGWEDEDSGSDAGEDEQGGRPVNVEPEETDSDSGDDEDDEGQGARLAALEDSESSDSEIEMEEKIARPKQVTSTKQTKGNAESKDRVLSSSKKAKEDEGEYEDDQEDEDEDEEDIPMSDLEDIPDEEKDDLIRHQRLTINNTAALLASLNRIAMPTGSGVPFAAHQTVLSTTPTEDDVPDVSDDLNRELAFYKQSLEAAKRARSLLRAEKVPFSRPGDYFAEMVKPDEHMDKVKAKLVEDATAKKAAAEARKLRDLKKFGKQVQVAKLQERQKAKKDTLEKIKSLKRKRQESSSDLPAREAELFDVGIDEELKKHRSSASAGGRKGGDGQQPNRKRQKKDAKYGFGGKKRHSKSGDAMSSGDLSGFSSRRMRGKAPKAQRPGKSKRKALAGKR